MTFSLSTARIRAILLDIEGTTTPVAFVYEVLFPFARAKVKEYLETHLDSEEVFSDLEKLRAEQIADVRQNLSPPALREGPGKAEIDTLVAYVHWLMDRDRKSTGLKSLQGKIWQQGYLDAVLKAQVFSDVPTALERWHRAGLKMSVFSSGSVLAQKLLFANTELGDLTTFVNSYFDTTTGPKTAAESYQRIAAGLELMSSEVLFISDVVAELDAAVSADMQTLLCVRPGNHPQPPAGRHTIIKSFDEVLL